MSYRAQKEKLKRDNCLSKSDVLGSFDFYNTVITLDSVDQKKLDHLKRICPNFSEVLDKEEEITPEVYQAIADIWPVLIHEYTHFLDATSTIWGLHHLKLMRDAYACRAELGGRETDFHHAKAFFDHTRSLRLPDYYTVVEPGVDYGTPWQLHPTVGKAFGFKGAISDKPILFGSFSNAKDQRIARSPISTISLLEASAMAQELNLQMVFLRMTPLDFRLVEGAVFSRKVMAHLYHPGLTEYSVCVHLVANRLQCKDPLVAFTFCASLTRIALNFPDAAFQRIVDANDLSRILNVKLPEDQNLLIRQALRLRDRGFVFYLLAMALPKNTFRDRIPLKQAVEQTLVSLHSTRDQLLIEIHSEAERHRQQAAKPGQTDDVIGALFGAGLHNLHAINIFSPVQNMVGLDLPPAWLGDDSEISPFSDGAKHLRPFKVGDYFNRLGEGEAWVRRFSNACMH